MKQTMMLDFMFCQNNFTNSDYQPKTKKISDGLKHYEFHDVPMTDRYATVPRDNRDDPAFLPGYDVEVGKLIQGFPPNVQVPK